MELLPTLFHVAKSCYPQLDYQAWEISCAALLPSTLALGKCEQDSLRRYKIADVTTKTGNVTIIICHELHSHQV